MTPLKNLVQIFQKGKFPFKFIYSDKYWMHNMNNHIFPVEKYRMIYEKLLMMGARKEDFLPPISATVEDILLAHTPKYVKKLRTGKLSHSEVMCLELPYSPELFEFALMYVGGTITAAKQALKEGMAVHLGGGFHHAFADHGEGFCILNDVAVAVKKLKKEKRVAKIMVVDVDVHQGNGTASILSKENDVFTFSIHQMDIYPAVKPQSSLDVGLWTGDGDEKYLAALEKHFPLLYEEFRPDLIFYLAGADPFEKDQLGSLKLTKEGLMARGRLLIGEARRRKIPVVVLLAGGYAFNVQDTVAVHLNTIKVARKMQRKYV